MNDDEIHEALERLGSSTLHPLDPMTEARIEQRLRAQHRASTGPQWATWPVLAGVAAAMVLTFALIGSQTSTTPVDSVGIAGEVDGGPTTSGPSATTTPPGSVDEAGDDVAPPSTDSERDPAPPEDDSPGSDDGGPGTTIAPASSSTSTSTTSSPPTTTVDSPRPRPARLRASVAAREGRAVIQWDDPARDVAVWVIVRSTEDGDEQVLRSDDASLRRHRDTPPPRGRVAYVVRGRDARGVTVVESEPLILDR